PTAPSRWRAAHLCLYLYLCHQLVDHLDLHSFPTRRSSDLIVDHHVGVRASDRHLRFVDPEYVAGVGSVDDGERKPLADRHLQREDRKSTRLNSSHRTISYAVFCLKKKKL